jgi:type I restriction enzyme S subunit
MGVIPGDWEVKPIGNCLKIRHGKSQHEVVSANGEFPIYGTGGEMGKASRPLYSKPSVLIGRKGTIDAPRYLDIPFWTVDTLFYSEVADSANPKFMFYKFCMIDWYSYNEASGVPSLNARTIEKIFVSSPPLPEQRAIAAALSDVDALLDKLDQLIAKKRDLKQATMQQLLTGQTRLPGFSGAWEVKRLDALADIRSGGTPSTGVPKFWNGEVLWCTPTDITGLDGYKYLSQTSRTITHAGLQSSSAELVPVGSVVMTSRATIGECAINSVPMTTNQGFKNFIPFPSTDGEFLYYLLQTKKQDFIALCSGSTFLEIGKTQLIRFEVKVPAKAEQTAIAILLSDMDTELAVVEARRDKTRALKQGMMQELLTGRIRLV